LKLCSVPLTWIREPKDIRAKAGDNLKLECVADGLPKPKVKWITPNGIPSSLICFYISIHIL
jgi:hypothetical protein